MINLSVYRGFTIIINGGSGGWIIQRLEGEGPAQKWVQYATVPGSAEDPSAAMEWINSYLSRNSGGPK